MALLWKKNKGDNCYEVRKAGNSIRLYTNGVFHSQWNPTRPFAGHLWDLLFLPTLFHSDFPDLNNTLILGVGGGAVINQLNRFANTSSITGVDLDTIHITIAQKYFLEQECNPRLIQEDAVKFVEQPSNQKYDFILEDLFCGEESNPANAVRAITASPEWICRLGSHLTSGGVLAMNFESERQLRRSLGKKIIEEAGFASLFSLSLPRYENAIAVCLKEKSSLKEFNAKVDQHLLSRPKKEVGSLQYFIKKIHG